MMDEEGRKGRKERKKGGKGRERIWGVKYLLN